MAVALTTTSFYPFNLSFYFFVSHSVSVSLRIRSSLYRVQSTLCSPKYFLLLLFVPLPFSLSLFCTLQFFVLLRIFYFFQFQFTPTENRTRTLIHTHAARTNTMSESKCDKNNRESNTFSLLSLYRFFNTSEFNNLQSNIIVWCHLRLP